MSVTDDAPQAPRAERKPDRRHVRDVALPRWMWVPAVIAFLVIALPVLGLLLEADWARMPELLTSEAALAALRLSLETAAASTVLCIVLGGPLAAVLARGRMPGLRTLRSVVLLPLVLAPSAPAGSSARPSGSGSASRSLSPPPR